MPVFFKKPGMRKLTVSSDINVFCQPTDIFQLYGEGVKDVEVIGWRWAEYFLQQAKLANLPIWRLHGRIGSGKIRGRFRAKAAFMNSILMPTTTIVRLAKKYQVDRVLLHVGEVRNNWEEVIRECAGIELAVENSDTVGWGIREAFETAADLHREGVNAKVVGDVGHYGLEAGSLTRPEETMQKFLELMSDYASKYEIQTGAHLPINEKDDNGSINVDEISDETLARFIKKFDDLVIENPVNPISLRGRATREGHRETTARRWKRFRNLAG